MNIRLPVEPYIKISIIEVKDDELDFTKVTVCEKTSTRER